MELQPTSFARTVQKIFKRLKAVYAVEPLQTKCKTDFINITINNNGHSNSAIFSILHFY